MTKWLRVPGYPHIEITRDGRVRTAAYTVQRRSRWGSMAIYRWKAREMTVFMSTTGYLRCVVTRSGKRAPIYVHRLIALTFVPGHEPGYHVNHINGKKTDNRPENLEWVPNEANVRHAWRAGLVDLRGEKAPNRRLAPAQVRAIRKALVLGVPSNTLAVIAGVAHATIDKIRLGHTWQTVHG